MQHRKFLINIILLHEDSTRVYVTLLVNDMKNMENTVGAALVVCFQYKYLRMIAIVDLVGVHISITFLTLTVLEITSVTE